MKECCYCKELKPVGEFSKNMKAKDGLQSNCRECSKLRYAEWYYKKGGKAGRNFRRTPEQKLRERETKTVREFGITLENYDEILARQGGGCGICGAKSNNNKNQKRLPIDHNHNTNEVRGILCHSCNLMLGLIKDNIETLEKAVLYLKEE